MPLTVLTDSDVRAVLLTLKKDDILELHHNLADALHSYSTGDTNSPCCSSNQPQRTVITKNGVTTLFMPASTGTSVGMKIVSLEGGVAPLKKKASLSSTTSNLSGITLTPASTISSSASTISGTSFTPPASIASSQSTTPRGTLTMLDSKGYPTGVVNAEELTAFRTALAATLMFQKRENVHTITVFGAGKQAYWHIRLALLLKGDQIKHVNIINRSFERSARLMKSFYELESSEAAQWRKEVKFSALSPGFGEYGRLLKEEVRKADAIFCCTPSVEPLFPAEFLTSHEGRRKGRYISAIGSYAPHMTELHPDIFRQAVEPDAGHHHHKHAKKGGVVIVDSLESCMKEAGEVIQAKLRPENLVEIGELIMVKRAALKEVELGGDGEKGLVDWLVRGNVIYKSVGMGLMDLVVGGDVVTLARERGFGTTIPDF
jgi:ornithine cyclodeaminase/alanine dehydrogenase-like protein (mu-crystallin family)